MAMTSALPVRFQNNAAPSGLKHETDELHGPQTRPSLSGINVRFSVCVFWLTAASNGAVCGCATPYYAINARAIWIAVG